MIKKIKNSAKRIDNKHYVCSFKCVCKKIIIRRVDTKAKSCGCLRRKERYIDCRGYVFLNKFKNYEHKIIMEKHLGRKLTSLEQIHHRNKNKSDNRLKNLILCKNAKEHNRYNNGWWKDSNNELFKGCPNCKQKLKVKDHFYKCKKQYFYICKDCCNCA